MEKNKVLRHVKIRRNLGKEIYKAKKTRTKLQNEADNDIWGKEYKTVTKKLG